MRYPASDKLKIIRLVEASPLPVRRTLAQLGIPKSAFYAWLDRYHAIGLDGLEDCRQGRAASGTAFRMTCVKRFWHWRSTSRS